MKGVREDPTEKLEIEAADEWWRHCETDSGGSESFSWSFTFDTSFKRFREEAKNDRSYTLELFDRYDESRYVITAGELSDGLRNQTFTVVIPAVQGAIHRRDDLQREHPKWNLVLGHSTRGSNTPYIRIDLDSVRRLNKDEVIADEDDDDIWEL
jgi:hypothetical protein